MTIGDRITVRVKNGGTRTVILVEIQAAHIVILDGKGKVHTLPFTAITPQPTPVVGFRFQP